MPFRDVGASYRVDEGLNGLPVEEVFGFPFEAFVVEDVGVGVNELLAKQSLFCVVRFKRCDSLACVTAGFVVVEQECDWEVG